jgi:hypothetical protein
LAAFLGACSRQPARDAAAAQASGRQAAGATAAEGEAETVSGTVLETMDAASYTYVRVKTSSREIWAATSQTPISVGDRVRVPLQMAMKDFHSPTLKRSFPEIYFVTHVDREGQMPSMAAVSSHERAPAGGATAAPVQIATRIEQPPGGTTVENIWAQRQALAGKAVVVRGKVVKFNGGILDRNWIHIQDGTGSAKDGTNDVLVTTQGSAKVGDIITVTGKVAVNQDFGSGYAYAVMIESATVK